MELFYLILKEGFAKRSIGGRRSGMLESNLNRIDTAYYKRTKMILKISIDFK